LTFALVRAGPDKIFADESEIAAQGG